MVISFGECVAVIPELIASFSPKILVECSLQACLIASTRTWATASASVFLLSMLTISMRYSAGLVRGGS